MAPSDRDGDEQWRRWEDRIKSGALLVIGLVGLVNELFFEHPGPRVPALAAIATILGLQFVLPTAPGSKDRR